MLVQLNTLLAYSKLTKCDTICQVYRIQLHDTVDHDLMFSTEASILQEADQTFLRPDIQTLKNPEILLYYIV